MSQVDQPSIRPEWSPDGRLVAVAVGDFINGSEKVQIAFVSVVTGSVRVVPLPRVADIRGLAWLDGETLVVNGPAEPGAPFQLWRLTYADGQLLHLTNDLNDYDGARVSADRGSLVTGRSETHSGIWVGDGSAGSGADAVPFEVQQSGGIAWAGARLLYDTYAGGRAAIMSVVPGSGSAQEVISEGSDPIATSDGRTILFESTEAGERAGLWKVEADGRRPVHLVADARSAVVTADDRSVIFVADQGTLQSLWTAPLQGGPPKQVVTLFAANPDVSPDGKSLVFRSRDDQGQTTMVTCELPDCASRRNVNVVARFLRWTPDSRALAYIAGTGTNLWVQPVAGGPPRQLTHFTDRTITAFAWSHDGKRLAISRSTTSNDIVLFKGLNPDDLTATSS